MLPNARAVRNRVALALLGGSFLAVSPAVLSAQSVSFASAQSTLGAQGLLFPGGMAVDGSGNIFVADGGYGAVKEILATGGYTTVRVIASGFYYPQDVALDSSGNLFVADEGQNAVKEILAAGGYTTVNTLGSGFSQPFSVSVDSSGNVFVADTFNNAVKEILAAGGYTIVKTLGSGFSYPSGVAVDGSGNVFVADTNNNAVKEILAASSYTTVSTLASGFSNPRRVAVDGNANVYVADTANSAVKEILAAGDYITVKTLVSGLSYPEGVAVDGSGNVFVSMSSPNDVVVELQLASVNFGTANVCPSGQTSPAPCSQTLALNYNITEGGALGTPKVLTGGVPSSDFSVAGGSTCSGAVTAGTTCAVNVTFTPTTPGLRKGAVEIVDDGGDVLASTNIYGSGIGGPQQFAFEGEQAFSQTANSIQLNGEASLSSLNHLLLTDGHHLNAAGSAFYFAPLNIQSFTTAFTFQLTHPAAEGITFTIQNVGPTALGATGGSLGYATIGSSVAIKFDLFNNFGEGPNSTDLYINGVPPTGPSLDLTSSGIDLHSGDPFSVHMTYSGTTLNMTITDTITLKSWSHAFMVDIPAAVGGDTAYVGFTASTGDTVARQTIDNWRFSNP